MSKIPFTDSMRFDPKTTLFVTDLDGTLLNPDATLPEGAVDAIHRANHSLRRIHSAWIALPCADCADERRSHAGYE